MANIEKETILTQEYVKHLFDYRDGFLYWKIRRTNAIKIGDLAGTLRSFNNSPHRRRLIGITGIGTVFSSRLIFLWHNGYLPEIVDHIDRNTENEKINNLRAATKSNNAVNHTKRINTSSKFVGVSKHKMTGRWQANIRIDGKWKYLGLFNSQEEAALKRDEYARIYYKEFAIINI